MKYLPETISIIMLFSLFILFAGEPDISDSIMGYIDAQTQHVKSETKLMENK